MKSTSFILLICFFTILVPRNVVAQENDLFVKVNFGIPKLTNDKEYRENFKGIFNIGVSCELEVFKFLNAGGFFDFYGMDDNITDLPHKNSIIRNKIFIGGLILANDQDIKDIAVWSNYIKLGYAALNFKHRETKNGNFNKIYKSDGRMLALGSNLNYIVDNTTRIGIYFTYTFIDDLFDLQNLDASNQSTATHTTQFLVTGINLVKKF
ncbi:MAG: hypothetical protein HRT71_18575 [Flavobacteriales bacterium]|nr:hypothetical protein [Flavobacteriales bacterium]